MKKDSKIYVAGHTGLVGSAIVRELERRGYGNVLTLSRKDVNWFMPNWDSVMKFFFENTPEYIFNCAAHAGGIKEAIDSPADMLIDNLFIQGNILLTAVADKVKKLLNFGSSCIYPLDGPQPYKEEQIGTGKTDENWSYAIAKLAGIELCRAYHKQYGSNFLSVVPCNVYGVGDNFDLDKAHVIPALIRKFHESKGRVDVWGGGTAKREFIYSDDLAKICVTLMERYDYDDLHDGVINVGTGREVDIDTIVELLKAVSGKEPAIYHDISRPGGVPSKLMDISRMRKLGLDMYLDTPFRKGLEQAYEWYEQNNH